MRRKVWRTPRPVRVAAVPLTPRAPVSSTEAMVIFLPASPASARRRRPVTGPQCSRMSLASAAALSSAADADCSPYMALPSCSLSFSSIFGQSGFAITFETPQGIPSAKPFRIGLDFSTSPDSSSHVRGGSRVLPLLLYVDWATFARLDRYSMHFQAASWFLPLLKSTRLSPAIVVAHPAEPSGSGAAAHLPLIFGNSPSSTPANQAPAMYMPTLPVAKATRPSLEFRKSFGAYFVRPT